VNDSHTPEPDPRPTIGIGRMGSVIGKRLAEHGYSVVVYDVDAAATERAAAWAYTARSPADLAARCSVAIVLVATDKQTLDCLAGENGLLAAARHGFLVAVSSTVLPATMIEAERLAR
jgi:3-hydroxyisobutyrate dehydrogenase-like beta-hydroxyacid dehydrogenase